MELFEKFGIEGRIFVRPDSPLKSFTGQTISNAEFEKDFDYLGFFDFPRDLPIVVSSPKEVLREWRFVVANKEVVTGSQYYEHGQRQQQSVTDSDALAFAQLVARSEYQPEPVWILDVGECPDKQYRVVEIGAFSYAGLYNCDLDAVADAVSREAASLYAG